MYILSYQMINCKKIIKNMNKNKFIFINLDVLIKTCLISKKKPIFQNRMRTNSKMERCVTDGKQVIVAIVPSNRKFFWESNERVWRFI